ncbi:MAG TPA: sensor histidine kinase [Solirubrobacteraceae bacterium]|nr:sensor histidine kinase [Solirubrobacteraceae bacterium]
MNRVTPRNGVWVALWVAAVVAELLALRPVLFDHEGPIVGIDVVFTLAGGSFAAFGLIAWRRRPDSRSGALMTATGFAFFASPLLSQLDGALASTVMILLVDAWIFFFVPLILTLLSRGRLRRTFDRWLVAAYALPLVVLQVTWLLFLDQDDNLLGAFPDADIAHVIDRIQRGLLVGILATTVGVIAVRWWQASAPRRRALLPSLAGALVLGLFTVLLVNDLISGTRSQVLLWITVCSLVTVPAAFLAGLLRSRLARGGLAELFRGLGGSDLQGALAKTMGDPGLVVARWQPDRGTYTDADGRSVALPANGDDRRVALVDADGRRMAALVYDASLDDDPELVEAITMATGVALENEHLQAEAQARLVELRASRERIVAAGDAERRRLERNLHDGAQQRLVAISLQLRLLQNRIGDDPSAAALVTTASDELARSLSELRELARGLHPAVLEHGLGPALDSLASRAPVPTTVSCDVGGTVPEAVELAAFFVASEALANVAKYAGASHAEVRVTHDATSVRIEIADDGIGGADDSLGSGLRGLADRVEALDGRLFVTSPPGAGTTVTAELPCGS